MKKLYPLCILLLLPFLPYSQDLVIEGTVTVQPEGLLHVEGNVEIKPTGVLDIKASGSQHGVVKVKPNAAAGSWVCDGTTTGGGDVQFLGSTIDYTVSGSNVSFPNLILNFGFPVGGAVPDKMTLNNNVTITQSLTLTKGRIVTGSNEVYIANNAANAITGNFGSEKSRFIQGTLRREITTGADTYYRFPIGSEPTQTKKGYNPISVDLRSIDYINGTIPSGVTSLVAKFVEKDDIGTIARQYTTSGNCYYTAAQQYLEYYLMVYKYGYWDVQPNDPDKSTGWNYDFYCFPDVKLITDSNPGLTHMKIIKAPTNAGAIGPSFNWDPYFFESGNPCNGVNVSGSSMLWFPGEFQPAATTDSIAAWDLKTFSRFGLGAGRGAGLPIELLYLEANPVDNSYIRLDWATATEINNAGFEVLRSTDGVNFTKIGWVDSKVINSSNETYYDFPDYDVMPNQLYYYRLRQLDLDGSSELTYIVSARITAPFSISEFIPNPSDNQSRLNVITSREENLDVWVYNTLGQVIMKKKHHVVAGVNTIEFNFSQLADGTYYAIIKADNEYFNRKLILTK